MDTHEAEKRAAYTSGLRKLADILDANPDVPLPHDIHVYCFSGVKDRVITELAAFARAMPHVEKGADEHYFDLTATLDGVNVKLRTNRSLVCEKQTVMKEVEEWVCPDSLLEYAAAVDAA